MKSAILYPTKQIQKLAKIEQQLLKFKKGRDFFSSKPTLSLKGAMKGIKITNIDIQRAKRSLFRGTHR